MALVISQPWWDWDYPAMQDGPRHIEVSEPTGPEESCVLGPDGRPLVYAPYPMGFDLRPKHEREDDE